MTADSVNQNPMNPDIGRALNVMPIIFFPNARMVLETLEQRVGKGRFSTTLLPQPRRKLRFLSGHPNASVETTVLLH